MYFVLYPIHKKTSIIIFNSKMFCFAMFYFLRVNKISEIKTIAISLLFVWKPAAVIFEVIFVHSHTHSLAPKMRCMCAAMCFQDCYHENVLHSLQTKA